MRFNNNINNKLFRFYLEIFYENCANFCDIKKLYPGTIFSVMSYKILCSLKFYKLILSEIVEMLLKAIKYRDRTVCNDPVLK